MRVIFRTKLGYTFADDCVYMINGETTGCYSIDGDEFRYVYWYAADPQNPTYTVSFNADGGNECSGSMDSENKSDFYGELILPECGFNPPTGKRFVCWRVGNDEYNPGDNDKPSNIPQTGDNGMIWLWVALLLVSGFGVVATAAYSKKRYSEK